MRCMRPAVVLGAYLVGLVVTAPATLLDAGLQSASDGRLRLAEAQGTLWSGAGLIEVRDAGGRIGIAKSFVWRFQPQSLLRGYLVCDVALDNATRPLTLTLSFSGIEFAAADIDLPAMALGLAMPKLAPLGLSGEVSLHVERLLIGRKGMQGNASLHWRSAASALTPVAPLGDYELRLDSQGTTTHALLSTLKGPLQLNGKGAWSNDTPPDFLVTAQVSRQYQQQLVPLLRLIAIERGEGSFEVPLK